MPRHKGDMHVNDGKNPMLNIRTQSGAQTIVDFLARTEASLLKLVRKVEDEGSVQDVADILHELANLRMKVEVPEAADKRLNVRVHERAIAFVTRADGRKLEAALHDLSVGGAMVACDETLEVGECCALGIGGVDEPIAAVVRGVDNEMTHLAFEKLDPSRAVELAKYVERYFLRY